MKNLMNVVKFEAAKVSSLKANENNARTTIDTSGLVWDGGIIEPLLVRKDGTVLKGHRRLKLAEENEAKTVPVLRLTEEISQDKELELLHDHGQALGLNKAEAYKQLIDFFRLGYTETRVAELKAGLLNSTWGSPKPEKLEEKGFAVATKERHRSKLQSAKRLAILPEYVAEEYISAMEDGRKSISVNDIKSLEKTYSENPERFAQVFEAVKEAKANETKTESKTEPKMLKKSDLEAMLPMLKSKDAIATIEWVLGKTSIEKYRSIVK